MVDEERSLIEFRLSTEDGVSTDKEGVSTNFEKVSTDRPKVSTDGSKVSTDEQVEGTEEQREAVKKFKQLWSVEEMARNILKKNGTGRNKILAEEASRARRGAVIQLEESHLWGNFKLSEVKSKKFEGIQAMYEKIKRSDEDFIAIGSVEDDRLIKRMNKKDSSKGEEIKQESKEEVKEEDKGEEKYLKRKQGTMEKKMKSRKKKRDSINILTQDDPSDIVKENDEL
ncbi:hypothetical protein Tco_1541973 [Tanacetum coccineum]